MIYVELGSVEPDNSFPGELVAAGIDVTGLEYTTRRIVGEVTTYNNPIALALPNEDESARTTIEAVLAAHAPFHNYVVRRIAYVKKLARIKVEKYVASIDLTEAMMFMIHVLWKLSQSQALLPAETSRLPAVAQIRDDVMAIRAAAVSIIQELGTLTDAEAGALDIDNHPAWPVL